MPPEQPARIIEATARALLEALPDAVVVVNDQGRIVLVNDQTEHMFGYRRDELIGEAVELLIPEQLRHGHLDHRADFINAPRRRPMGAGIDLRARHRDGTEIPVEISLSPLTVDGGTLVTSIIRDVTERRRVEEGSRRWAEYFDRTAQGLAIVTPDGSSRIAVNPAYARMHGYTVEELTGPNFVRLTHPDRYAELQIQIRRAMDLGHYTFETVHVRKDGSTFPVILDVTVIRDDQSQVEYRIMHTLDITDRERAQADLEATAAELRRSNDELEQFAYIASHDLQEPLRMVASYTQLLARRYQGRLDADADEFIGFAVEGAQRMRGLINDWLEYSKVGSLDTAAIPTDCNEILRQILADLRLTIEDAAAEIVVEPLPTALVDATQLRQVFLNLISNAIKFRGDQPCRILVSAQDRGDEWQFGVTDNGIGIEPRYAERVFALFQRLHTRDEYPGTGIGLAVCKKIIERHGGRIWIESPDGPGTAFYFTFPKKRRRPHD